MIYCVKVFNIDDENCQNIFVGFSNDSNYADKYAEYRKEKIKKTHSNSKVKVVAMSDDIFDQKLIYDPAFYTCTEINQIKNNIFLTDDDMDQISSAFNEKMEETRCHIQNIRKTLKYFKCNETEKLRKQLKEFSNHIDDLCLENLDYDKIVDDYII